MKQVAEHGRLCKDGAGKAQVPTMAGGSPHPLLPAPLFLSPESTVRFSNTLYYLVRPLLAPCLQSGGGLEGESTHISAAASLPLLP